MWTLVFYGMVRYHAYVLLAANKQRVDLVLNIAMSLVNIALNLVLIPRYSHLGAAVATLISIVTYGFAQYVYLRVKFPGHAAPLALPPIVPIASAMIALLVWWIRDAHVLLIVALAVPSYAALLFAGGFLTRAELAYLAQRLPLRMNGARS
jgi:O-antigen/teichoic acid export membrane protein